MVVAGAPVEDEELELELLLSWCVTGSSSVVAVTVTGVVRITL